MSVKKQRKKSHISEIGDGLTITIPTEKTWLVYMIVMLFTGLILFGIPALNNAFRSDVDHSTKVLVWFLAMTGFIFLVLYLWAWDVFGNEIVSIDPKNLSIRKVLWNSGKPHSYKTSQIRNLRVAPKLFRYEAFQSLLSDETIAFDYEGKTYRFAAGVEKTDIKQMLDKILEKFPQLELKK